MKCKAVIAAMLFLVMSCGGCCGEKKNHRSDLFQCAMKTNMGYLPSYCEEQLSGNWRPQYRLVKPIAASAALEPIDEKWISPGGEK